MLAEAATVLEAEEVDMTAQAEVAPAEMMVVGKWVVVELAEAAMEVVVTEVEEAW